MSVEFVKAYKNFNSFLDERNKRNSSKDSDKSTGLLAPRANRRTEQTANASELDKVADYVQQIRKHRMKLKNGE